jgi:hypothetical protein
MKINSSGRTTGTFTKNYQEAFIDQPTTNLSVFDRKISQNQTERGSKI